MAVRICKHYGKFKNRIRSNAEYSKEFGIKLSDYIVSVGFTARKNS